MNAHLEILPSFHKPLALVTSISTQKERELARQLIAVGYQLIIVSDDAGLLLDTAQELRAIGDNPMVETIEADLSSPESAEAVYEMSLDVGPVDLLVNNAGANVEQVLKTAKPTQMSLLLSNVLTTMRLTRLFAADMATRQEGMICFAPSVAAPCPSPVKTLGEAGRALMHSFAMGLRGEMDDTGVVITTALPWTLEAAVAPAPSAYVHPVWVGLSDLHRPSPRTARTHSASMVHAAR